MSQAFPQQFGFSVSRETKERLDIYLALLRKWNPKINLVAPSTIEMAWARHFLDSAQVFALRPDDARTWVDLGSGGGFPGLVTAILAQELAPQISTTLIEADTRKATFLRTVARDVDVPVRVIAQRIETADPQGAEVVSARALAPLPKLLGYVVRHCHPEGTALLMKGARVQSELSEARKYWHFSCEESPSLTDSDAVVLKLRELRGV